MARESLQTVSDSSILYQWTFNSNDAIVNNPRCKATKNGNPTFKDGIATFNGSTDYYKLKTLVNLGTKYTIKIRAKATFTANGDYIIGGYVTTPTSLALIDVWKTNNAIIHCGKTFGNNIFPTDQQMHTYIITRNGTVAITLYIDGVLITTVNMASNINCLFKAIGALDDNTYWWKGSIEEITIWNRPLSASEVVNNYYQKTYKALPLSSGERLGSELVVNGTFDSGSTGWTTLNGSLSYNSGTKDITITSSSGSGDCRTYQTILGLSTLKIYKIKFQAKSSTATISMVRDRYYINATFIKNPNLSTVYQDYELNLWITSADTLFVYIPITTGQDISIDNVSIKEVLSSSRIPLFYINSDNGVIRDVTGKTTPSATNVALPKLGSGISVMKFDGASGNINLGSQVLTGDITICGWINLKSFGGTGLGTIIHNGRLIVVVSSSVITTKALCITRNNSTYSNTSLNSISNLSNILFFTITSNASGTTNMYLGNKLNSPTLSYNANQSAGTPVAGTTDCYIGSRVVDNTRVFDGWSNDIAVFNGLLTLDEITQWYSATKFKYN